MITMADVERWRGNNSTWDGEPGWFKNHVIHTEHGIVCWHEDFRDESLSQAAWEVCDSSSFFTKNNPYWKRLNSGFVPSWVLDAIAGAMPLAPMQDPDFTLDEIHAGQEMVK